MPKNITNKDGKKMLVNKKKLSAVIVCFAVYFEFCIVPSCLLFLTFWTVSAAVGVNMCLCLQGIFRSIKSDGSTDAFGIRSALRFNSAVVSHLS